MCELQKDLPFSFVKLCNVSTSFQWIKASIYTKANKGLTILSDQVNSNYSTVTNAAPYKLVFGREPRGPPVFGREGLVIESVEPAEQDPSFSTAYDLDDSYQEVMLKETMIDVKV